MKQNGFSEQSKTTDQKETVSLVERRGGIQLWRQIAELMRQGIVSGAFRDMMPPETALAERFGVNRHTVRNALAALSREGLVEAVQGRGTLILKRDRLTYPIGRRTRFSEGLGDQAGKVEFLALADSAHVAGPEIGWLLDVDPTTPCVTLDTLGLADGVPVSRASHVFAGQRFQPLPEIFRKLGSITAALRQIGVADYERRSTDVLARPAGAEDLADLKLSPGAILLETLAVNAEMHGHAFQYSRTRFAADRIQLRIEA